jgi:LAS superfamily LD-carboxypeptidase LdcB
MCSAPEDTQVDHPLPPAPTDSQPTGTWHDSLMTVSKLERYLKRPAAHEFDDVKLDQYYERYKVCKWSAIPAYARNTFWTDRYDAGRRMAVYRLRGAKHFHRDQGY